MHNFGTLAVVQTCVGSSSLSFAGNSVDTRKAVHVPQMLVLAEHLHTSIQPIKRSY